MLLKNPSKYLVCREEFNVTGAQLLQVLGIAIPELDTCSTT
jgi:hypothetical protein